MTNLSKEQIEKLTPEQQLALAESEMGRIKKREELIRIARGGRRHLFFGNLILIVPLFVLFTRSELKPDVRFMLFLPFLFIFVMVQVGVLTKRQDALFELLQMKKKDDD